MKIIKGFLSFIFSILIFVALFAISLSFIVKNTLQKEILTTIAEEKGTELVEDLIDDIDIPSSEKQKIKNTLLKDKTFSKYITIYIDNYIKYVNDDEYKVSKEDASKIIDFAKTTLKTLADSLEIEYDVTSDDYELVDTIFKSSFKYVDDNIDEDFHKVVEIYAFITSPLMLMIGIGIIVVLVCLNILLIGLKKGIKSLGITMNITGIILLTAYILFTIFKTDILSELPFDLKLTNLLIYALILFIFGIIIIIVSKNIKKQEESE